MLNIGFKAMAQASLTGVVGLMLPGVMLASLVGSQFVTIFCAVLFAFASGFGTAALMDGEAIKSLKQQLAERVPITRGDKGRFVKHE